MSVSMRLEVRQSQSLALTPQLLQSIRLLQFDRHDLADFLRREGDRNPLLTVEDRSGGRRSSARLAPRPRPARADALEMAAEAAPSLCAHVLTEIADIFRSPAERRIAEALCVEIDEAGYLRMEPGEAAARLGIARQTVEAVLSTLRAQAEPAGLFARDLAQCLGLQLERQGRLDDGIAAVLSQLELVAKRDLRALSRLSGRDADGVAELVALLRSLDPKPGSAFGAGGPVTIEPDVFVEERDGGGWHVVLNARSMPRVSFDADLTRDILAGCRDDAERAFLEECRAQAAAILRAVDRRANSILTVATHVLRRQKAFLAVGPTALRPMTLAAVAQAVGLHESTVSRIVSGKFVSTPRGTFELKFFFSGALASSQGAETHSASGVRERIRLLVAAERPGAVLSDEDIAARLRAEGVELARRTVAKYREALGIASSARRRREMGLRRLAS